MTEVNTTSSTLSNQEIVTVSLPARLPLMIVRGTEDWGERLGRVRNIFARVGGHFLLLSFSRFRSVVKLQYCGACPVFFCIEENVLNSIADSLSFPSSLPSFPFFLSCYIKKWRWRFLFISLFLSLISSPPARQHSNKNRNNNNNNNNNHIDSSNQ